MKQCFILTALVSALIFFGCAKDGTPGLDGENGEQGIPGVDGTALLNGNGAPNNSLGKNGDFYLDKTTVSIYGPKTAAGWGEATSLKGKDGKDGIDGTNGKDGSKILSGNQIPTMQDGAIGDFYFDTQNIAIYGPKTSDSWGTPVSLKTPTGKEVTVLLYKNHSFQTITEDIDEKTSTLASIQSYIEDLENDKIHQEATIVQEQQIYNDAVSYINSLTEISEEDKVNWLAEALQVFNIRTEIAKARLTDIEEQLNHTNTLLQYALFYNMQSIIPIDSKYQDIYDNGIVLVQLRKANNDNLSWSTDDGSGIDWSKDDEYITGMYAWAEDPQKEAIEIKGEARGYTEPEIKAAKMDIKIVLIPATNVIEMQAKGINTRDFKAVAKHMEL